MSDKTYQTVTSKSPMTVDIDRILQALTMEYESLNAQMNTRLSARYQFLGFLTAGAAILAAASGHRIFSTGTWVLASLATAVFAFGVACFWYLTRGIAILANRVADIEERINKLVPPESANAPKLLSWESDRRGQTSFRLFVQGFQRPQKVRSGDGLQQRVDNRGEPTSRTAP
jgi:hypothetical protein